jgi:hypothetical protein
MKYKIIQQYIFKKVFFTISFLSLLLVISCTSKSKSNSSTELSESKAETNPSEQFNIVSKQEGEITVKPGEIYYSIPCPSDSSFHFSLYLPINYQTNEKTPVFILFDPHGHGANPIEKYKELADQYNFILVGSNDSKNGNSKEITAAITTLMLDAAYQYFPNDSTLFFAGGFSGGARVASMLALGGFPFQGLFVSGAGFPSDYWKSDFPKIIIGAAGNNDMNRNELISIEKNIDNTKNFQFIKYEGKHEWPPYTEMEQVFIAFKASLIKRKLILFSKKDISMMNDVFIKKEQALLISNESLALMSLYDRWSSNLIGLSNINSIENKRKNLLSAESYIAALNQDKKLTIEEQNLVSSMLTNFGSKDITWWKKEMLSFNGKQKNSDKATAAMYERVRGILSLNCYMNLTRAMQGDNMNSIRYLSALYVAIDEENCEAWYLAAILNMKQNLPDDALYCLKKAKEKGFTDTNRMIAEDVFSSLQSNPKFTQLMQ